MARLTKEEFFRRQLEMCRWQKKKNKFYSYAKNIYEEIDNRIWAINKNIENGMRTPLGIKESKDEIWAYNKIKKILKKEEEANE